MSRVIFDISMSLDGFITAAHVRPEEPLGDGGQQLHDWAFGSEGSRGRQLLNQSMSTIGAVIAGRHTYDLSIPWWGADGPTGPVRLPVFVITHAAPAEVPKGSVYTFITDGIESALRAAKAAAGGKDVSVMGGAELGQQYLKAGLLDEISIHLVPVLFGDGIRLFDNLGNGHIQLELADLIETSDAIHLRYQVIH